MNSLEKRRGQLISILQRYGYPKEFGMVLAEELHSEKAMVRMIGYLLNGKPSRPEDIVDEALAIKSDFERFRQKKITEYNNRQYNRMHVPLSDDENE